MIHSFPPSLQKLVRELSKLPSIGEKSAIRLAYFLISNDKDLGFTLSAAITEAIDEIRFCSRCFHISDSELCSICRNVKRDSSLLCVVEKPMDLIAIERMGEFKGYYHVLHGLWAPLKGLGLESMKLEELVKRVKEENVEELVLATSSTVEGDATALYIGRILADQNIKTTRLAQGMPKGGELEYADNITLSRAMSGRSLVSL